MMKKGLTRSLFRIALLMGGAFSANAQTTPDSLLPQPVVATQPAMVSDTPETVAEVVVDSLHDKIKRKIKAPIVQIPVTARSLIIPGLMFTYGALATKNGALQDVNLAIKRELWDKNPREKGHQYEDYFLLAPAVMVYGLNFLGYKSHNNIVDRSIMYGMANLISNGIVFGLKEQEWELRPSGNNYKSFPSGHTAQAFVSAEFARLEYRGISPWPGLVGYAFAFGAGFLRMYNNEHWFSDVVAGAGVGIVAMRFSYYIYPAIKKKLFKAPKIKGDAMLLPSWNGGNNFGLHFAYLFP